MHYSMKLLIFVLTFIFLQTVSTEWIQLTDHKLTKKTFTIALAQNPKGIILLENIIANISDIESPQYGKYLSPSQIDALIATPKYIKDGVLKWLYKNKITDCYSYADSIKCTLPVRQTGSAHHRLKGL